MRIAPLGDAAVVVELGRTIDPDINARVLALDHIVLAAGLPGVRETVPTYRSLLVHFDPLAIRAGEVAAELRRILASGALDAVNDPTTSDPSRSTKPIEIPVDYGGAAGPDLGDLARHAGLTPDEVIRRHAAGEYRVAMLGFAPGFPYLLGMDPAIAMPRLATPRVRVPAGSVAIADAQTGIYPFALPGGWRLIGWTALPLFDAWRDPPATLLPGDLVRFVAVEHDATVATDGPTASEGPAGPKGLTSTGAPAIRVVEPGVLATVQDGGRWGYQRVGVPPGGAADRRALAAGNLAVGNDPEAASVEVTAGGAEFEFLAPTRFAVTGADVDVTIAGHTVALETAFEAGPGDRLRLGLARAGLRAYLCVAGGIDVPSVLGSRSTYLPAGFGGLSGRALRPGDLLPVGAVEQRHRVPPRGRVVPVGSARPVEEGERQRLELPFLRGGEWDEFPAATRRDFLARRWRVSHRSDRIGLRLEGEPLQTGDFGTGFASDGTVTGAIQVSGDGLPIVLLVDHQTTGGYPKLGAVPSVALPDLGQARAGDELVFREVSVAEAEAALRDMRVQDPDAPA